jgi:hypothetical protein
MLERLLDLLARGGVHTPGELAACLGVSNGLLDQMLADLSRMGYLRQVGDIACAPSPAAPPSRCGSCSLVGACAVGAGKSGSRVWALTDKILRQNPRN